MTEDQYNTLVRGLTKIVKKLEEPSDPYHAHQLRPPTVDFYMPKGGQLQFSVAPPRYRSLEISQGETYGVRWTDKAGAVFIEAAAPNPNREGRLDWKNKIIFALSDKDIGQILWGWETKSDMIRITHAPGDDAKSNNKTFSIKRDEYNGKPQWTLALQEKKNGESKSVSVYVSGPDMMRLRTLLVSAFPFILGSHKG